MELGRLLRHLLIPDWWALRGYPKATLGAIGHAITASERSHQGELRFVLEASLPLSGLLRDQTPRQRAIELFAQLGVWDTEGNSGVLIYLQLIDRRVEIVADRGINARVGGAFWQGVCQRLESALREQQHAAGVLRALDEIGQALTAHFPATVSNRDELPDAPVIP